MSAVVHKYRDSQERAVSWDLRTRVPELTGAGANLGQDFAIAPSGDVLVPASWRSPRKDAVFGVFMLSADGAYRRTVVLTPPVEARHVAPAEDGSFFVLGIDAAYFQGRIGECALVHRYAADGRRLSSFSSCPEAPPSTAPLSHFYSLKPEVDRGQLWTQGGLLYHVLPMSRIMRSFDLEGRLIRVAHLKPPPAADLLSEFRMANTTTGSDRVWRLAVLADGNLLVEWLHSERRGASVHNMPYLCLHDAKGQALGKSQFLPWRRSVLVSADEEGYCYFFRQTGRLTAELVRIAVSLNTD